MLSNPCTPVGPFARLLVAAALFASAAAGAAVDTATSTVAADAAVVDPLKDVTVAARVRQVLAADPYLADTIIEVATAAGVVTLQGRVVDLSLRQYAARLAELVFGVTRVDNQLVVTLALG